MYPSLEKLITQANSREGKARVQIAKAMQEAKTECFKSRGKTGQYCEWSDVMADWKKAAYRSAMK